MEIYKGCTQGTGAKDENVMPAKSVAKFAYSFIEGLSRSIRNNKDN